MSEQLKKIRPLHIMSVLGTGLYEPVIYGDSTEENAFFQISLIEKYHEDIKVSDGNFTIFLTSGAKKSNWNDRIYSDIDVSRTSKWHEHIRKAVVKDHVKKGLESIINEKFPDLVASKKIHIVDIKDGKSKEEIAELFDKIYKNINDNEDIVFDVTHSFRSIPILVITVLNYAKALKNISVKGIFYGAYEAAVLNGEKKEAPVFDLTPYDDIIEWANAAREFEKYGDASYMSQLIKNKKRWMSISQRKEIAPIEGIVKAMDNLSMTIQTGRGAMPEELEGKDLFSKSIYEAYKDLKKKLDSDEFKRMSDKESADLNNPVMSASISPLLSNAVNSYSIFDIPRDNNDVSSNYKIGLQVVNWSIDNNMIQQGYTALEETIKTFLCNYFGLPDNDEKCRDHIIGSFITSYSNFMKKYSGNTEKSFVQFVFEEDDHLIRAFNEFDAENKKELFQKIAISVDTEDDNPIKKLFKVGSSIKNDRNDINHFGIRPHPSDASSLKGHLEKYYAEVVTYINALLNIQ